MVGFNEAALIVHKGAVALYSGDKRSLGENKEAAEVWIVEAPRAVAAAVLRLLQGNPGRKEATCNCEGKRQANTTAAAAVETIEAVKATPPRLCRWRFVNLLDSRLSVVPLLMAAVSFPESTARSDAISMFLPTALAVAAASSIVITVLLGRKILALCLLCDCLMMMNIRTEQNALAGSGTELQ